MNREFVNIHPITFLLAAALFAMTACSNGEETAGTAAAQASDAGEPQIVLTKVQFEQSGMQLGQMQQRAFSDVIRTHGIMDVPPGNEAAVSSTFSGNVKQIQLLPGDPVKKGETLFTLENPEFVEVQQDYLKTMAEQVYLKADYERQQNLAEDNVASQKAFLKAESDYEVNRVRAASLASMLAMMHINPESLTRENIRTSIPVLSPISGYVTQMFITRGAYLHPEKTAVSVMDTRELQLQLNIFERDLPRVREGQIILFRIQEEGDTLYQAYVHRVNRAVDEDHRTVGLTGVLSDERQAQRFNPGMYVEAEIQTTSMMKPCLPLEAVVEIENSHYVLVRVDSRDEGDAFEKRQVQVGASTETHIEILNGDDFEARAQFLVRGAFDLITD